MISSKYLLYKISAVEIRKLRFNPNHDKKTGEFTNGDGTGTQTQENCENYNVISISDWFPDATPNSHEVQELQEYTKDGVTYVVDGKWVKNDHTEHEKKVAQLLEDKVGGEIFLVPKVEYPQGIKTPDYIFNGVEYDLKCITSNKKNAIYNLVHKKKGQSKNFIFDFSSSILTIDEINEQINYVFTNQHTSFVDEIVVINNGEIALIVRRNTQ